jgi:uncharacterized damage-inducible protein DinB
MEEQLIDTWSIHDRINRYLLAAVPPDALGAVAGGKGRTVGEQFAHLHNVRLMWLGAAAPELANGLAKIEKGAPIDKPLLDRTIEKAELSFAHHRQRMIHDRVG